MGRAREGGPPAPHRLVHSMTGPIRGWTFLTHHARVLIEIARNPSSRLRDIADRIGITERSAQSIVTDLEDGGYITRTRVGRRNQYTIDPSRPFRLPHRSRPERQGTPRPVRRPRPKRTTHRHLTTGATQRGVVPMGGGATVGLTRLPGLPGPCPDLVERTGSDLFGPPLSGATLKGPCRFSLEVRAAASPPIRLAAGGQCPSCR